MSSFGAIRLDLVASCVARNCGMESSSLNADVNAPDWLDIGPGVEGRVLRTGIDLMDSPRQVFRDLQIPFNECPVDRQLCRRWGQLLCSPAFHLPPHRLELTLHPVHAE